VKNLALVIGEAISSEGLIPEKNVADRVDFPGLAPWATEMPPSGLSSGLLLRKIARNPGIRVVDGVVTGFLTAARRSIAG